MITITAIIIIIIISIFINLGTLYILSENYKWKFSPGQTAILVETSIYQVMRHT